MPALAWAKNPGQVAQAHEARHGSTVLGPLLLWAAWAVEGLYYLDDLDGVQVDYPNDVNGHHADVVDIAHVRWATSSAVTALDLCAAILGRLCCGWSKPIEMDLRGFDPSINLKEATKARAPLAPFAIAWLDAVLADQRYKAVQGARNPLTHAWMNRNLQRGANNGHASRTTFKVKATGTLYGARD